MTASVEREKTKHWILSTIKLIRTLHNVRIKWISCMCSIKITLSRLSISIITKLSTCRKENTGSAYGNNGRGHLNNHIRLLLHYDSISFIKNILVERKKASPKCSLLFDSMSLWTGHHRSVNPTYTNHLKYYENILVLIIQFLVKGTRRHLNNHNQ